MKTENIIKSGLAPRQIYILETLLEKESCTMKELTSDFMSRVNLTNAVDSLEMLRFVKRRRDVPDRRSVRVSITENGKQFISQISEHSIPQPHHYIPRPYFSGGSNIS